MNKEKKDEDSMWREKIKEEEKIRAEARAEAEKEIAVKEKEEKKRNNRSSGFCHFSIYSFFCCYGFYR